MDEVGNNPFNPPPPSPPLTSTSYDSSKDGRQRWFDRTGGPNNICRVSPQGRNGAPDGISAQRPLRSLCGAVRVHKASRRIEIANQSDEMAFPLQRDLSRNRSNPPPPKLTALPFGSLRRAVVDDQLLMNDDEDDDSPGSC